MTMAPYHNSILSQPVRRAVVRRLFMPEYFGNMIKKLGFYVTQNTEPCLNLAVEMYLTFNTEPDECILYLWQNRCTVVIGRNQNAWKECRVTKLREDGGSLVRRLSGGGAVFHDLGNLNFTFCVRKENYDVERQLSVILRAAAMLGIRAEKTGRNDITVQGRKFSGNAFYDSEGFCYHHGTLLLDANVEDMTKYLSVSAEKLRSRGVDSVHSRVCNLKEFAPQVTAETMAEALKRAFEDVYGLPAYTLREERLDANAIEEARRQFASWDWTYGKRIPFQHSLQKRFPWGDIQLQFDVNAGLIRQVNVFSDGMRQGYLALLPDALAGCRYEAQAMAAAVARIPAAGATEEEMCADITGLIMEEL